MGRSNPAFVGLLVGIALGSGHAGAASGAHQDAIREYLIVKHCGLETEEVRAGFRIEVITLVGDGEISAAEARADRNAAAEHVRRHWRNRGMGPADPRCLSEGRAAVCHFLAVVGIATGSDCSQQHAD
jgi:hypothetical protein